MDILQVQDRLKNFSQDQLVTEMQAPTGSAPQFLVLSEIMRRKRLQDDFAAQQGKEGSDTTVAQEAIAAAGVPQGGIADMAQSMAPSTDMTQNTGVQAMASGGTVKKMAEGDEVVKTDPAIIAMANRSGMSVEEFLSSLSPEEAANLRNYALSTATRERMTAMEPVGEYATQADLDQRAAESAAQPDIFPAAPFTPSPMAMDYGTPLYQTLAGKTGNVLPPAPVVPAAAPAPAPGPGPMDIQMERAALIDAASNRAGPQTALAPPAPSAPSEVEIQRAAGREAFTFPELVGDYLPEGISIDLSGTSSPAVPGPGRSSAPEAVAPTFDDRGAAIADRSAGLEGVAAAAKAVEEAKAVEAAKVAEETAASQGGGGGGGGGGIAGVASGTTSYEQELMDALTRREKAATQDKWLALAQVGLNLMSSTNPTLGGALGEAGLAGVQAAQGSRDQYEKDRLDLTGALEQSRMSRAQAAAAAAGRGIAGAKPKALPEGALDVYDADIEAIDTALADPLNPPAPADVLTLRQERARLAAERASLRNVYLGQYGLSPAGASPAATSGVYSMDDVTE